MKINVVKRGMNIVNGNHHGMEIIANNTRIEIVICGMKINVGNEK
jgi:hypothetical protein